jgi:Transposase, Mutator family
VARSLAGVALVTSDDHAGLVSAIAAVLPGAAWLRCRTHYRNLLTRVPKSAQPWVSTLVRTIFEQPDAASVRAQHAQVVRALEAKLPQAAAHLDEARDDILAFTAFPREVWRQIWSNNPLSVNASTRRSGGAPTSSASSRTATPSSASSARSLPSKTTNGPNHAATWEPKYSPPAAKPPGKRTRTKRKLPAIQNLQLRRFPLK